MTEELAGIPMRMTSQSLLITLALAIVVGFLSGFLSLSRLQRGTAGGALLSDTAPRRNSYTVRNPLMLPRKIIPLAWRNLTENRRRLLTSVAGTAFAVTLMFMENGFRHAMLDSMVNVIERLDGQVVIVSRTLYTPGDTLRFPYRRVIAGEAHRGGGSRHVPGLRR